MVMIVPVVEGDGDAAAFPELLIRILGEKFNRYDVSVARGKTKVVKANSRDKLESDPGRFLRHAQRNNSPSIVQQGHRFRFGAPEFTLIPSVVPRGGTTADGIGRPAA